MEDDTDSIPQIVKITKNEFPLLSLVKSVINLLCNDRHMILTNLQLTDVLRIEFNIDVKYKTELEAEVYLNVLKHFLKTWPCWDDLHVAVQNCTKKESEHLLKTQCESLKKYLQETLTNAEDALQPYHAKLQKKIDLLTKTSDEVVMKINCSRGQLNQLIYNQPHPSTGTIFNVTDAAIPNKISTEYYTLHQIVNSPNVQMHFYFPGFECCRVNSTTIDRHIVNMKRLQNKLNANRPHILNQGLYFKKNLSKLAHINKDLINLFLKELETMVTMRMTNSVITPIFKMVLNEFRQDLERLPTVVTGGEYRFNLHKYKYIRRLFAEPNREEKKEEIEGIDRNNYDLHLEEMLTPQVDFQITKLCLNTLKCNLKSVVLFYNNPMAKHVLNGCWAKVECLPCQKKFEVRSNLSDLLQHFEDHHECEPFWICTSCQNKFSVKHLTTNRWTHDCKNQIKNMDKP